MQIRAIKVSPGGVRGRQRDDREGRRRQLGLTVEICPHEAGARQIRTREIGTREISTGQVESKEIRASQIVTSEIRTWTDHDRVDLGPIRRKRGGLVDDAERDQSLEIRAGQIRAGQVRAVER